jgi:hypothetical protein
MTHRPTWLRIDQRSRSPALVPVLSLGLALLLALSGCSRSTPVSLPPDQIQTLHQDHIFYTWASGDCPTSPPPAVRSARPDQAILGEESWPSGGKAGFECATTSRIYMAGARFSLAGVDPAATTNAHLAFRLDVLGQPPIQPSDCAIELSVAEQDWALEDSSQGVADPYAVLLPGKGSALGAGSPHAVTYHSATQTVTVDVTAAVSDWLAQRRPNQGFLFKSLYGCHLTRLSGIILILGHD